MLLTSWQFVVSVVQVVLNAVHKSFDSFEHSIHSQLSVFSWSVLPLEVLLLHPVSGLEVWSSFPMQWSGSAQAA